MNCPDSPFDGNPKTAYRQAAMKKAETMFSVQWQTDPDLAKSGVPLNDRDDFIGDSLERLGPRRAHHGNK